MPKQLLGLGGLASLFSRKNPQSQGKTVLARLMSRHDMENVPYSNNLTDDNRDGSARRMAVGVWMVPSAGGRVGTLGTTPVRGVTVDVRPEGFGVLTMERLSSNEFVVALPCLETPASHKFLQMSICHNTLRPGGWFHIGLRVEGLCDADADDLHAFRQFVERSDSVIDLDDSWAE